MIESNKIIKGNRGYSRKIKIFSKLNFGWIMVILFSVLPIILWLLVPKIDSPLGITQYIVKLGEVFGLIGIVMFSLNLILSTRLSFIERLFNGLNNVYQKHSILGQIAFILLLFHPLFLIPRYSTNLKEAASFLFLSNLWARNFGILALGIVIILIILTLYLRPKYNIWKITHKFFGLALFLGALHVYLTPSYIMNNFLLKFYVLSFAILGLIAFFYKTIFGKYLIKKYNYTIENINKLNKNIIEISFRAKNSLIKYKSGQFIFISFKQKGLSPESHPFSISSSSGCQYLKITIKKLGDFTKEIINNLQKGTLVEIEGPHGVFSYTRSYFKNQIWIAGGIGITPFISFVKDLENRKDYRIQLFYCVVNKNEAVYLDLLKEVENNLNNNFIVIPFYSEEKGHISAEYLFSNIKNINGKDIFICAPPRMIREIKKGLEEGGINKNNIYSEEFNF